MLFGQWISYRWAEEAEPVIDAAPPGELLSWSLWIGGKERAEEGKNERWRVYKKEGWSLKSFISGDFPPGFSLGGSLLWDYLVTGNTMSSTVWSNEEVSTTELFSFSHVFAFFFFFFVFLNILICASVYVRRKKGEGFVSVQKLPMIHVSSALICELCAAPG